MTYYLDPTRQASESRRRPSAATGLEMLDLLAAFPQGLGVSTIAQRLNLDAGHAHRILTFLLEDGWIQQTPESKAYKITGKILGLAGTLLRGIDLREIATSVLTELREKTDETTFLLEARGDSLVCIERHLSGMPVVVVTRIGDVIPLVGTAAGAALRAARAANAPSTVDDEIRAVMERGYSVDVCSYRPGVCGVASVIRDFDDNPIGVVAIVAPAERTPPARQVELGVATREAAAEISKRLGFVEERQATHSTRPEPGELG